MNRVELFNMLSGTPRNTDKCSYILSGLTEYSNLSDALRIFAKNQKVMGLYRSINQKPYDVPTSFYYLCVSDDERVIVYFTDYDWYRDRENKILIIQIKLDKAYTVTELLKFNITDFFDHSIDFCILLRGVHTASSYKQCKPEWIEPIEKCEYDEMSTSYIMSEPLNIFNKKKYYKSTMYNAAPDNLKPYIAMYLFNCSSIVKLEYEDIFTNIQHRISLYSGNLILSGDAVSCFDNNTTNGFKFDNIMNVVSFIARHGTGPLNIFDQASSDAIMYFKSLGKVFYDKNNDYTKQLFGTSAR